VRFCNEELKLGSWADGRDYPRKKNGYCLTVGFRLMGPDTPNSPLTETARCALDGAIGRDYAPPVRQ